MVAQAQKVTVLADYSKLAKAGLFQVCSLSSVDCLVVTEGPIGVIADALPREVIQVIVAVRDD